MSIEALKQALEALEIGWSPKYVNGVDAREKGMKAITSIRQAIAEAEKQEPYGWISQHTTKGMYEWQFNKELSGVYKDTAISILPVYTHPQPKRESISDAHLYLESLVEALDGAFISSWQSTHAWKTQLDEARDYLAAHGIKENA